MKIIGDIHGQFVDLMRFFDIWKSPQESGDIHAFDYLFLGNYVDTGQYSLEVACLLMALKLKLILLMGITFGLSYEVCCFFWYLSFSLRVKHGSNFGPALLESFYFTTRIS